MQEIKLALLPWHWSISSPRMLFTPRRDLILYENYMQLPDHVRLPRCQLSAVSFLGGTRGAEHCMQPGRASKQARLLTPAS